MLCGNLEKVVKGQHSCAIVKPVDHVMDLDLRWIDPRSPHCKYQRLVGYLSVVVPVKSRESLVVGLSFLILNDTHVEIR